MEPQKLRFGGGATDTILHPLVAVCLLAAVILIVLLPRKKAITPFLLAFLMIPAGQVLVLGGIHWTVLRILVLTVLAKMIAFRASTSRFAGGFNRVDTMVTVWALLNMLMVCLQWMELQAWIKSLGDCLDALGGYLAIRFLIPDGQAVRHTVKVVAAVCVIQGVCMISEQFTHQNVFSSFGANSPTLREGHIRSEGPLGTLHGGTFAGVSIPLFLWLWTEKRCRVAGACGLAGATAMVFASHASTSWGAYAAGLLGLAFWPLRRRMRLVRWGIVATLVGLHLVMHGPVWSLLEKIDLTGGSSSYHRYMLVDNCIRHFGDWWLAGYKYYGSWGFDMWDLCNQFVSVALTGGLASLVAYIAIYRYGFGAIGDGRKLVSGNRQKEWFFWCLGAFLFANVVASFGINYMVQLMMLFSTLLACVSVATTEASNVAVQSVGRLGKVHVSDSIGLPVPL